MAFDENLAARIQESLRRRKGVVEKKMFGGIGFMLRGNLCVGVWKNNLIARIGPDNYEDALNESFVAKFDITGREMTGWVMVEPEGIAEDDDLKAWIDRAMKFVKALPAK